jgi:hypothetical protein
VDDLISYSNTDWMREIDAYALTTILYLAQRKTISKEGKGVKAKQEYAL